MDGLRKNNANEARAKLDEFLPRLKLNEIYDGIRDSVKEGFDTFCFDLQKVPVAYREPIIRELEKDGYRIVKMQWGTACYNLFW